MKSVKTSLITIAAAVALALSVSVQRCNVSY